MAKSASGGPDEPEGLPQHPLVEQLKPDPAQPARRVISLTGLPGNSDRAGYQRIYLTSRLDYYAEFLTSDIVSSESVPADRSPIPGHEATRVSVGRDATIHYVRVRTAQPLDEFDLDIRLGAQSAAAAVPQRTIINGCTDTCHTACDTCPHTACDTCPPTACGTCHTQCGTCPADATCAGHGTCVNTQCVQQTCVFTQCNQATCVNTQCAQATCVTCPANATCAATCHV
jgi:hypothetical protein